MPPSKTIDPKLLFERELPLIKRQIRWLCRRKRLNHQDEDEFFSYALRRFWKDDYAVLGKYRGDAPLQGFLAATISRMLQDFRIKNWGRWRPSAAAQRLGALAVELECLTERDRLTYSEASELLRQREGPAVTEDRLDAIWLELPHRVRAREVDEGSMPYSVVGTDQTDGRVAESEARDRADAFEKCLVSALRDLDPEDRSILKLCYWQRMTVANVARALNLEQKPLYRRIDQLKVRLRRSLETAGIDAQRFNRWIGRDGFEPRIVFAGDKPGREENGESGTRGPSYPSETKTGGNSSSMEPSPLVRVKDNDGEDGDEG